MNFVLVNHEPPPSAATCGTCSRSIRSGYVRHVRTQRHYCDYDCYRRGELMTLWMPWSMPGRSATATGNTIEMLVMLSAVSCWTCTMQFWTIARALTGAFLDGRDLITTEGGDT
ncbi:hypothetical protein XH98_23180 [Bradyrhizobium sp. CCBAU 51745]|nr:hypothetical protein [Bradyrhizobium sp. CCBAU 51745]